MASVTFVPTATQYEPANAHALACVAQLAYSDEGPGKTTAASWGFPKFKFIDIQETQAIVLGNDDLVIIAFRGTEPSKIRDVISDIRALQTPGPWGNVHRGFDAALNHVFETVAATLAEFRKADQGLFICGHSLGAALATLAAARLVKQDTAINGVYTYGQPRTGDLEFGREYNVRLESRHFRFANNNDDVTRIPLEVFEYKGVRLEYTHVGRLVYITTHKSLSTDISGWAMAADRVMGRIEAAFAGDYTDGISDHNMEGYIAALESNLGNNPFA